MSGIPQTAAPGYNERLFSGEGLRHRYHSARFKWAAAHLAKLPGPLRIVELGCFDGRLLDYVQNVGRYVGMDANWEGGLDSARKRLSGRPEVSLMQATSADALASFKDGTFDTAVSLETMEHIPDDILRGYIPELARVTKGNFFISVPNEMGLVFLTKYLAKTVKYGGTQTYSPREFVGATLWRPDWVKRCEHKGFDYRRLVELLQKHIDVVSVVGIPAIGLPPSLSLTVAIHGRSR